MIVGSGLSGYAAAAKLMENGFKDIIILEAESYQGGRINSTEIDKNKFIDYGAQWVNYFELKIAFNICIKNQCI